MLAYGFAAKRTGRYWLAAQAGGGDAAVLLPLRGGLPAVRGGGRVRDLRLRPVPPARTAPPDGGRRDVGRAGVADAAPRPPAPRRADRRPRVRPRRPASPGRGAGGARVVPHRARFGRRADPVVPSRTAGLGRGLPRGRAPPRRGPRRAGRGREPELVAGPRSRPPGSGPGHRRRPGRRRDGLR